MIEIGTRLDLEFEVKALVDGEEKRGSFKELLQGDTLVSVYMKNNTSSCDRQTQALKDAWDALQKAGVGVIAVSKDTLGSHKKYACKLELPYVLVSDPEMKFAAATDSLVEKKMYGRSYQGPSRSAYLVDGEGVVKAIIDKVDSPNHAAQALSAVGLA